MWALFILQLLRIAWVGTRLTELLVAGGLASIAVAWDRHLGRRALWLTDSEVVISNSAATHVVPKVGATAAVVEEESFPYRYGAKPDWDNTVTAARRLYVIPGDRSRNRIQVEAALGLTPRRLRAVRDELEHAFEEAS